MNDRFDNQMSDEVKEILTSKALVLAEKEDRSVIHPKDLILSFFQYQIPVINKIIKEFSIDKDEISKSLEDLDVSNNKTKSHYDKIFVDRSTAYILQGSDRIVTDLSHPIISVEHIIAAFLEYNGKSKYTRSITDTLNKFGLSFNEFKLKILDDKKETYNLLSEIYHHMEEPNEKEKSSKTRSRRRLKKVINKKDNEDVTIHDLEKSLVKNGFITNLNDYALEQDEKFIGKQKEMDRCIRILMRKKKKNAIIIGEPGTGKTSFVEGLSRRIIEGDVPEKFKNMEIYSVNLNNIIAGTKYRGQFEERMRNILFFMEKASIEKETDIVMFIDEIHTICNAGSAEGSMDAGAILKPFLSKGAVQCIGTSTMEDYRVNILKDPALMRRFSTIFFDEPSAAESAEILKQVKEEYELYHDIDIPEEIIDRIVDLSDRFIKNRFFPDKAFDILDESCSKATMQKEELTESLVHEIISEYTSIPISTVKDDEKKSLSSLYNSLKKHVIAQDDAIRIVSDSIKRSRVGLKDPEKPIGVYLFLGSTGLGKTLLAKKISENLFGKDRLIRLDMSEFMDKVSSSKITGSPPGYVGYDDGTKLVEEVRKRPYSVILLDEIEKAHKDVLNIFLQIFDEGRMTDSLGRLVDFRNTIIIMTSNLATSDLNRKSVGFDADYQNKNLKDIEKFLKNKVNKYFSPEFINRIDEVVIFNKINQKGIRQILEIEINKTKDRIRKIGYDVEISKKAIDFLCERGYNSEHGARPMFRVIQKFIETPFASKLLDGEFNGKHDVVLIDTDKESLTFTPKERKK